MNYTYTNSISQKILVLPKIPRINLRFLWIFGFLLVVSLLVFYVFQINSITSENHFLRNQERRLTEITREAEVLKIDFARTNSLANIETYFENQNFKKINQVKYIQISDILIVELPKAEQTK